jgi:sugar lactone lactonase YvrE
VKGNLWAATARLGGILQIDPRGIILGFVPVPNGDLSTTNFASADQTTATSFWRARSAAHSGASRRRFLG